MAAALRGKPKEAKANSVPGPGNYETHKHMETGANVRHNVLFNQLPAAVSRMPNTYRQPGPGAHDISKYNEVGSEATTAQFSRLKSSNSLLKRHETPGPGAHNLQAFKEIGSEAPMAALRGKPKADRVSSVPGPKYNLQQHRQVGEDAPAHSFSRYAFTPDVDDPWVKAHMNKVLGNLHRKLSRSQTMEALPAI
jgi:hypothetical protein